MHSIPIWILFKKNSCIVAFITYVYVPIWRNLQKY